MISRPQAWVPTQRIRGGRGERVRGAHGIEPVTIRKGVLRESSVPAEGDVGLTGIYRAMRPDDDTVVSHLISPDGSWCEVTRQSDSSERFRVEAGPTPLWSLIETAWSEWTQLGAPPWHEFGLTATPDHHPIWLGDPQSGPSWPLPTPAYSKPCRSNPRGNAVQPAADRVCCAGLG